AAMIGGADAVLTDDEVAGFVREQLAGHPLDGRSVCVLVPDATRVCPLPLLLGAVRDAFAGRVARWTVLVALGTHPAMGEAAPGVGLHAVSFGEIHDSWAAAAEVCAATHVRYLDAPVRRVLSIVPTMYDEIWTAAKGFYKVEPVVADGGEVVLYAPHVREFA